MYTPLTEAISPKMIEHSLIDKIRRGDTEAFAALYDKYAPVLLGVILKITADKKTGEDLLHKAFLQVWAEIKNFDPVNQSLVVWMLSIARSTAFSAIAQKNKTREIRSNRNSVNSGIPVNPAIKAGKLANPEHIKNQYSALELVYFKEYSLEEAAQELKISVEALKIKIRKECKMQRRTEPK